MLDGGPNKERSMPVKPRSLKELFLAALAVAPTERAAWLERECGQDPDLRQRVELMLAAHDTPQSLLDRLAPAAMPAEGVTGAFAAAEIDGPSKGEAEAVGALIAGRYKLIEEIGEGGMGTVWMAQQTEPVRRLVALKVIKPGMDSKQVLARFEAERQALALMDHPNIARVLDAGATDSGRPYFVMELVKGVPLTRYCDEHRLTPKERLELFIPVCQAIQHAHQKGIIHRDIKPSNVLVALYDGKPVPKVIDFGIAKATGQQLTEKTLVTGFGSIVGTLEYMSPEQAELNQLDIDTRSDIYSLGVLLYELLTGTTPLERKRLKEAALLEVLRIIREEEPARPSMRLSTTDELPSVAANRGLEPKKLSGLLRGELDWIVMKALEKDRNRRYETANGFAVDVQRYLADEPVHACPPSAWYRFRKFARRNKVAMTTVGLVSATLVLGAAVSGYFAYQAGDRAAEAVAERDRAQKNLRGSLEVLDLITELDERQLALEPHQEPRRAALMKKALTFYERFLEENAAEPSMRRETGMAYRRAGDLHTFLGNHAEAEPYFQKGIALLERLAREFPQEPAYRRELASTYYSRVRLLYHLGRLREGKRDLRRALDLQEQLAADHDDPEYRHDLAQSHNSMGVLHRHQGQSDAEERAYGQALRLSERLPAVAKYRKSRVVFLGNLGKLLQETGRVKPAEQAFREAITLGEQVMRESEQERPFQAMVALTHGGLAGLYKETSRPAEAEREFGRALELSRRLLDDFPGVPRYRFNLAYQQHALAVLCWKIGKRTEADRLGTEACGLLKKLADDYPQVLNYTALLAVALNNLSQSQAQQQDPARACELLKEAIAYQEKALAVNPKDPQYRSLLGGQHRNLAMVLWDLKAPAADVENAHRRALDLAKQLAAEYPKVPNYQSDVGASLNNWASWLLDRGQLEQARQLLQEAITWQEKAVRANRKHPTYREFLGNHYRRLATVLHRLNSPEEEQALRNAVEHRRALLAVANLPAYQSEMGGNLNDWALFLMDRGQWEEARRLLDEAIGFQRLALASEPGNRHFRVYLCKHYKILGKTLLNLGELDGAAEALRQRIAVGEGLVKEFPDDREYRYQLASDYTWLSGGTLGGLLRPGEKEHALRRGITVLEGLLKEGPENAALHGDLAVVQFNLAVLLTMQGHLEKARPLLEQAAAHARAAFGQSAKDRPRLLAIHGTLFNALLKLGDHAAIARHASELAALPGGDWRLCHKAAGYVKPCPALAAMDRALAEDRRKELIQAYVHQFYGLLAECARRAPDEAEVQGPLALFLTTCPDPKYRDAARAVELAGKALKQDSKRGSYWAAFGLAQYRAGKRQAAITALEKARQLKEGKETLFVLAMAYWEQGEKQLARERHDEALEWLRLATPHPPWAQQFRDEAAQVLGLKKE
jgi:tetratricopeptide (TPR) repeat protein